ncbi:putative cryptochrome-1 [Capsicum annuum]|nr:putative cryptochrome-1 [Capsicum annuum]
MPPPSSDGADTSACGRCTCSTTSGDNENQIQNCQHCRRSTLPSSSSSCSLLSLESYPVQDYDKLWRIYSASVKGFTIGAGLKGGLAIFAVLSRLGRRKFSKKVQMVSSEEDIVLALKETLRYGLFLGTFSGTFVSVDEIVSAVGGHRRTAKWRAFLAGAIAGPSMLLTGNTQHTSLAIYILMRATVLASRCGIKSKRFGRICKPLTWAHGDIFLMCLSSSQILIPNNRCVSVVFIQETLPGRAFDIPHDANHSIPAVITSPNGIPILTQASFVSHITLSSADNVGDGVYFVSNGKKRSAYILKQDSLHPSYKSFLNKHGGKALVILQGVKDLACGNSVMNLEAIENHYKSNGIDIKLDPQMKVPCSIVHENQGCGEHFISFLIQAYKRALPVYLPVYLVPAFIVHRQGLLKRPNTILAKGLLGTARSSLFLSVYCSSAWLWTCILFRLFKRCNVPMVALGTFPTGLALAIEKKSRRIEISLYCLARALESFVTCMADVGYLPMSKKLERADVLIFSVSTAVIMHCYAMERDVFKSKYLNVLDWVFGVPLPPYETTPRKKK